MIGFAPLDDEPRIQRREKVLRRDPVTGLGRPLSNEDTECNYLVMFFILGVFVLAATDSVGKSS
jgi:hypothetical protein